MTIVIAMKSLVHCTSIYVNSIQLKLNQARIELLGIQRCVVVKSAIRSMCGCQNCKIAIDHIFKRYSGYLSLLLLCHS